MDSFSRWLDPLLVALVVIGVALVVRVRLAPSTNRRAKIALGAAIAAWAVLWLSSTPIFVYALIEAMEPPPGDPVAAMGSADVEVAIVVLGAGLKNDSSRVPLRECVNDAGTGRILGGARFYAAHPNAFVILSGGPPIQAEASLDLALHEGIPRDKIEVEPNSRNTRENAVESMAIVKRHRAGAPVVVVTSALHMKRALSDFRRLGVAPIAAPVDYLGRTDHGIRPWFPDAVALGHFYRASHELLGALKP